jgi:membrane protein HdeD
MSTGAAFPTGTPTTTPKSAATILIIEGVVLALLGLGALFLPVLASLAVAILVGWILAASGIMGVVAAFTTRPHVHFWWSLFSGIIAIIAGGVALVFPPAAIVGLTIVIAVWLAMDGVNSFMAAAHARKAHGGAAFWLSAAGVVDWVLAVFLVFLPAMGEAVALGVIVGVDLLFGGFALIGLGAHLRRRSA